MNLFQPAVPEDRYHQHFQTLLSPSRQTDRNELLKWADGFPDRDGKLVQEFQTTFNSTFWEIYLFAVFKEYGFTFDWTHHAPDFLVSRSTYSFNIEATTANAATGKPNEWDKTYADFKELDTNKLNKEAIIRISNSINNKHKNTRKTMHSCHTFSESPLSLLLALLSNHSSTTSTTAP